MEVVFKSTEPEAHGSSILLVFSVLFFDVAECCELLYTKNYPASRGPFDLPGKVGKRKGPLLAGSTFPVEHALDLNVT